MFTLLGCPGKQCERLVIADKPLNSDAMISSIKSNQELVFRRLAVNAIFYTYECSRGTESKQRV